MELSFILTKPAHQASKRKYFRSFGKFNELDSLQLPDTDYAIRKQVIFEELLFAKFLYNKVFDIKFEYFANFRLFNSDIPAGIFYSANSVAFVLVPLDNSANNVSPSYMHLWLFDGIDKSSSDHRKFLEGSDIIPDKIKIFLSFSNSDASQKINGKSWQLGYKLAETALKADSKLKQELAVNWIITGTCSEEKVGEINLGNKLDLSLKNKKWLIPVDNIPEASALNKNNYNILSAFSLDDAWSHITGDSSKQGATTKWPVEIDELHILVGGSIKAPFMPLLLTKTNKVVLWTSESQEQSKDKADILKEVVEKVLNNKTEVIIGDELSSYDINKTEKHLLGYFKSKSNLKILFNITSGTRLMGLGAQTVARLYPNVELIYRDFVNKESGEFIHLLYTAFPPYSGKLQTNIEVKERYNWDFLNENEKKKPYKNADDFIEQLAGK